LPARERVNAITSAAEQVSQLMIYVKTHVVARCKTGGGRSAQEHLVPALRRLYRHAVGDRRDTAIPSQA
jgi:hypothetical protein